MDMPLGRETMFVWNWEVPQHTDMETYTQEALLRFVAYNTCRKSTTVAVLHRTDEHRQAGNTIHTFIFTEKGHINVSVSIPVWRRVMEFFSPFVMVDIQGISKNRLHVDIHGDVFKRFLDLEPYLIVDVAGTIAIESESPPCTSEDAVWVPSFLLKDILGK